MPRIKVLGISLNPGPFTIKEHVGTVTYTICPSSQPLPGTCHGHGWCGIGIRLCGKRNHTQTQFPPSDSRSVKTDIIAVQRVLYNQTWSFACENERLLALFVESQRS
jgi:hypothetical protein